MSSVAIPLYDTISNDITVNSRCYRVDSPKKIHDRCLEPACEAKAILDPFDLCSIFDLAGNIVISDRVVKVPTLPTVPWMKMQPQPHPFL